MKKTALIGIFLFSSLTSLAQTNSIEKSFNWVSADRNDLQRTVYERLRKETSYPAEINMDEFKIEEKRREAQTNLSKYESLGKENCNKKFLPKDATQSLPSEIRDYESRGTGIVTDPNWDKYYSIRSSKEYVDCFKKIDESQEHIALVTKQREVNGLLQKRREFDEAVRKKSEKILEALINEYAKSNEIKLIISNPSNSVIYNKDLVVLDVTQKIKSIINAKTSLNNTVKGDGAN